MTPRPPASSPPAPAPVDAAARPSRQGAAGHGPVSPGPGADLPGHLAGRSLNGQVFALAMWPLLELAFQSLVGLTDTALSGRLGAIAPAATDAVGVATYMMWLMGLLHMAVGVGAGALIARAIGARHRGLSRAVLGQAVVIAVVWGAVMGAVIFAASPWIVAIFQLQGQSHALAVTYLRIIAATAPLAALLFVGGACLRSAGDTRSPFLAMVVVNVVNIAASVALTFGPAPIGGHGVAGIAAGTAIGWTLGGGLILGILIAGKSPIRLVFHRLWPHWHTSRRIVRIGLPNLVESSGMWVGNAIIGAIVGSLAAAEGVSGMMGAHTIAIRIESLSFLPAIALGTAAATLTGQYLGVGDPERAARAARRCWSFAAPTMALLGLVFVFLPGPLVWVIAPNQPGLQHMAMPLIRIAGPVQFFFGTYLVFSRALRGAGDTVGPMVITYLSTFLIRLPAAYFLAVDNALGLGLGLGLGLPGVWLGLCGELLLRGCFFAVRFQRGRWKTLGV